MTPIHRSNELFAHEAEEERKTRKQPSLLASKATSSPRRKRIHNKETMTEGSPKKIWRLCRTGSASTCIHFETKELKVTDRLCRSCPTCNPSKMISLFLHLKTREGFHFLEFFFFFIAKSSRNMAMMADHNGRFKSLFHLANGLMGEFLFAALTSQHLHESDKEHVRHGRNLKD